MPRSIVVVIAVALAISLGGCSEGPAESPPDAQVIAVGESGTGVLHFVRVSTDVPPIEAPNLADWKVSEIVESTETGEWVLANPDMGRLEVTVIETGESVVMYYDGQTVFHRQHSTNETAGVLAAASNWTARRIEFREQDGVFFIDTIELGESQ